ncbi:hypothetical protein ACJJTC_000854 [Scirpophaga incertulas]
MRSSWSESLAYADREEWKIYIKPSEKSTTHPEGRPDVRSIQTSPPPAPFCLFISALTLSKCIQKTRGTTDIRPVQGRAGRCWQQPERYPVVTRSERPRPTPSPPSLKASGELQEKVPHVYTHMRRAIFGGRRASDYVEATPAASYA